MANRLKKHSTIAHLYHIRQRSIGIFRIVLTHNRINEIVIDRLLISEQRLNPL